MFEGLCQGWHAAVKKAICPNRSKIVASDAQKSLRNEGSERNQPKKSAKKTKYKIEE